MDEQNELRCIGCGAILQVTDKKNAWIYTRISLKKGIRIWPIILSKMF